MDLLRSSFDFEGFSDSSGLTQAAIMVVVVLVALYFYLKYPPQGDIPPGPTGVPYFGYYPFLKDGIYHLQLQDIQKQYGDVFSFTVFGQLYINLGTLKALKEAHVTKSDCFAKRYSDFNVLNCLFPDGVACANDEAWKVQRKFFVQAFRELGMTSMKDYMAGSIYDCMTSTVERLESERGKPVNIIPILNFQSTTILRRMMFNDEGMTEEEVTELTEAYMKALGLFFSKKILLQGALAKWIVFPLSSDYRIAMANRKIMVDILKKIIKRHEETFNKDNIRDIIDKFINERNDRRSRNDATSEYFTENSLISNLIQFVGDGISGVAVFVALFIAELVKHPEEQEKLFKELEEVVGIDRQPTMEDKSKLPYTSAFMYEVIRTTDFITSFLSLECTKKTTVNGYEIPKGAVTLVNFWTCNRDPVCFKDPDEFRPSRFIIEPGKEKPELPNIFGIGKRSCIGEAFTLMQTFLFITTIVKNFRLTAKEKGDKLSFGKLDIFAHPRKQKL